MTQMHGDGTKIASSLSASMFRVKVMEEAWHMNDISQMPRHAGFLLIHIPKLQHIVFVTAVYPRAEACQVEVSGMCFLDFWSTPRMTTCSKLTIQIKYKREVVHSRRIGLQKTKNESESVADEIAVLKDKKLRMEVTQRDLFAKNCARDLAVAACNR